MVKDISVSSEDFNEEFTFFELDDISLGTVNFLAEVFWSRNGLVVAIDVVDGLETNHIVMSVNNNEFLDLVRGARELGEERTVVEFDGVRMVLSKEIVFRSAPHR